MTQNYSKSRQQAEAALATSSHNFSPATWQAKKSALLRMRSERKPPGYAKLAWQETPNFRRALKPTDRRRLARNV